MPSAFLLAFEFFKAPPPEEMEGVLTAENSYRLCRRADSISEKMRDFPEEAYAFRVVVLEFVALEKATHSENDTIIEIPRPVSGMIFLDAEPLSDAFIRTRDGLTASFDPEKDTILVRDTNGEWNEKKSIPSPR